MMKNKNIKYIKKTTIRAIAKKKMKNSRVLKAQINQLKVIYKKINKFNFRQKIQEDCQECWIF